MPAAATGPAGAGIVARYFIAARKRGLVAIDPVEGLLIQSKDADRDAVYWTKGQC